MLGPGGARKVEAGLGQAEREAELEAGLGQAEREAELEAERKAEFGAARARLEAERERIREEISSYPAPIAGCDEQFNFLLERRAQVRRELARLVEEERLRRGAQRGESV